MQLCFGCLHTFPAESLETVNFSTDLSVAFESLRSTVNKFQPATSVQRTCVANIEDEVKNLFRKVKDELQAKDDRIETLLAQVKYLSDQEEYLRKALYASSNQPKGPTKPTKTRGNKGNTPPYASGLLHRFLVSSNMASSPRLNGQSFDLVNTDPAKIPSGVLMTPGKTPRVENRFGDTISPAMSPRDALAMAGGSARVGAGVVKAPEIVAATLYNMVEAMTNRVRGSVGILWLVGMDRDEALAPFVYDYGKRGINSRTQSGTPFHVNLSSSTVGTVYQTGTAINVHNKTELHDTNLTQQFTGTNHNSLYIPVFMEVGRAKNKCFGVYQVIAGKGISPFTEEEEAICASGCGFISHIINNYQHFISEWTNRVFDSFQLRKAAYNSQEGAEQNAANKGKALVDHFVLPPSLVYRCSLVDPTARVTKSDVQQSHPGPIPMTDHLREQHRYCGTLETSWRNAVSAQADLEKKVEDLLKELDLTRQGLNDARKNLTNQSALRFAGRSGGGVPPSDLSATGGAGGSSADFAGIKRFDSMSMPSPRAGGVGATSLPAMSPGSEASPSVPKKQILTSVEFEEIDADAVSRLKSIHSQGHMSQRLAALGADGSKGGSSVVEAVSTFFMTQQGSGGGGTPSAGFPSPSPSPRNPPTRPATGQVNKQTSFKMSTPRKR